MPGRVRGAMVIALLLLNAGSSTWAQQLDQQIRTQLTAAGENRAEIQTALDSAPDAQKPAMRFLVAWMPVDDLQTMTARRLLENVDLAHKVRHGTPWKNQVPDDVFRNYVLPHACIDEPRDPWRAGFHEKFMPLVAECTSTSEAAQILNQQVFGELGVKYSTRRRRANQSPAESIEQGLASCSGLSIILVDACRSVGVPARIVGIPDWANKRGNHTWVEIWDDGWHFTGAAEYDPQGLNRAWFTGDAAQAQVDNPAHSIYAVGYAPTGVHFPLPWDPANRSIPALNVTQRYTREKTELPEGSARVLFSAKNSHGQRVALQVRLAPLEENQTNPADPQSLQGTTRDESRDTNEFLELVLPINTWYRITVSDGDNHHKTWRFRTSEDRQQMVQWDWDP